MKTIVFFLEEPSAMEMLSGFLPKLVPKNIAFDFKIFEGKQDLEKRLVRILKAWKKPDCHFVVMRDQDSGDCLMVKQKLVQLCEKAGRTNTLVRVACHELESFYLGDLEAIEKGFGLSGLKHKQKSKKFRAPDRIHNPSEELLKLTKAQYQKISGSRAISPHLKLSGNRSQSFNTLITGIKNLIGLC